MPKKNLAASNRPLTRFNKIATQGAPQMAVDKEANSLSRVYSTQVVRSCNIPVRTISTCCGKPSTTLGLQQSQCKIHDGTRQPEYQIHVREGRVDKSFRQNYRKPSHVCAIMSCTDGLFNARMFQSGCWPCMYGYTYYSIATQPVDYRDYLISKLYVYLFF